MRKTFEQQVVQFLGSDLVSGEEKRAAMARFKDHIQAKLEELLGVSAVREFKRHPAGAWVDEIYIQSSPIPSQDRSP